MWAAAISAAASIAGSIIQSRRAKKAYEENQDSIKAQRAENNAYYDKNYYADATQMTDNRAALTEAKNALTRQAKSIAGRDAVMGSSNASSAAAKEAANEAYAGAVRGVAANAQQYKQHVQDNYRSQNASISAQERAANTERSKANAAAVATAVQGIGNVASAYIAGNSSSSPASSNSASSTGAGNTSSAQTSGASSTNSYNPETDSRLTGGAVWH